MIFVWQADGLIAIGAELLLEDFVAEALRLAANTRKSRSRRPAPPFGHIVRPVGVGQTETEETS